MVYRTSLPPVFGLRREIDRLFEDTFGRGDGMSAWSPAVDVQETTDEMRLDVELPGIKADDVELTAENGILTIRGEKRAERKEGEENSRYHVVERSYGSFTRSFQLPKGLDESKIEADYKDGILSVHIPKTALPQPRKIQIGSSKNGTEQQRVQGAGTRGASAQNASGSEGRNQKRQETAGATA